MISIIICSIDPTALEKVSDNIATTISVPFELIVIDNRDAHLGICAAYNSGAAKAKYDIFCFMHEDISFETIGWGQKVIDHLRPVTRGLIGLAGGSIKSWVPSSWSSLITSSEISYIQHFKEPKRQEKILRTDSPHDNAMFKKVVCIDGFWMCTKREVFTKYTFDASTLTGFHGYDIDFSLQVFTGYDVGVVFDIMVHHFSEGSYSKSWMETAVKISNKWEEKLPLSVKVLPKEILLRQHWTAMKNFLDKLLVLKYGLPQIIQYYFKYSFKKYFYWKHFLYFFRYIFLRYFGKINSAEEIIS